MKLSKKVILEIRGNRADLENILWYGGITSPATFDFICGARLGEVENEPDELTNLGSD